jgi:enediyne biosynthesis protein E4
LGRYDASYGLLLKGAGDGSFSTVDMELSGVVIDGQAPHMAQIQIAGGRRGVVVARNNDRLVLLLQQR